MGNKIDQSEPPIPMISQFYIVLSCATYNLLIFFTINREGITKNQVPKVSLSSDNVHDAICILVCQRDYHNTYNDYIHK